MRIEKSREFMSVALLYLLAGMMAIMGMVYQRRMSDPVSGLAQKLLDDGPFEIWCEPSTSHGKILSLIGSL